jgi:hypothetical protein
MERLLELLNEYEKEIKKSEYYEWEKWIWWDANLFRRDTRDEEWSHLYSDTADTYVISKKYGFIKWLVENDKIDFELDRIIHKHKWIDFNTWKWIAVEKLCDKYESLLMLLAIQDEPIKFLISILKNV